MKRRTSLKDSYLRKLKREGIKHTWNRKGQLKRKKPLKKMSRSRRNRLKQYYPIQQEFLARPENKLCAICRVRREHGENIRQLPSTEVHHLAGRGKQLLFDTRFWAPSCFRCRMFPHDNPKKAEEWGLRIRLAK